MSGPRLGYEVGLDGVGNAVNGLNTVKRAQDQVADGLRSNVGQSAQTAAQHLQGTAAAVANLATRMGAPGVTTGANLIGSIAGSTAQFASMGAVLGPGGALAGAIAGAVIGLVGLATAHRDAAAEATAHAVAEGHAAAEIRNAAREAADAAAGTFGSDTSDSDLTRRRDEAAAAARATQAVRDRYIGESEAIQEANRAAIARHAEEDDAADRTLAAIDAEIRRRDDLRATQQADAEERRRAADAAAEEARQLAEIQHAAAEEAEAIAAQHAIEDQQTAEATAARAAELAREQQMVEDLAAARARIAAAEAQAKAEQNVALQETILLEEEARRAATPSENEQAAGRAAVEEIALLQQKADAYHTLTLATEDATLAFSNGHVSSINEVIDSWHALERTSRASGTAMLSQGRLLERGMVAVGNNIGEVIGSQLKGAFNEALGAWLDGSLSFVEAAERMAKGVIKSLVQESIVQVVVNAAQAIGAVARQDYVAAAGFGAAAAAWAAVGVVGGAVGAGIGAFGGGGASASGGSASAQTADANRERARQQEQAVTYNIVVNPGGFVTTRDVERGIVDGLNRADRNGYRPDFAGRT
jgi:hypothetical protein